MGKLQGIHLLGLALAYISTDHKLNLDEYIKHKVPNVFAKIPYIDYVLLLMLFILNSPEHALMIWSLSSGYKAIRSISNEGQTIASMYMPAFIVSCLLVSIYDTTIPKQSIMMYYALVVCFCLLWISGGKTTSSDIIEDFFVTHLLFYFTK